MPSVGTRRRVPKYTTVVYLGIIIIGRVPGNHIFFDIFDTFLNFFYI